MELWSHIFSFYFPGITVNQATLIFMLIFTRWSMISMMAPFLGAHVLPSLTRVALAFVFSCFSFLLLSSKLNIFQIPSIFIIGLLFVKEALLGFILGFLSSLIFYAYEIFGELTDFFRAAGMSRLLVPEVKHASSPMGVFLFQTGLILFISLGLHRPMIGDMILSFEKFDVLSLTPDFFTGDFVDVAIKVMSSLFLLAVRLSLPILAISLIIDFGFGLLNRIAPQINAYFLSLPAKMIGGLLILFFVLPFLFEDFASQYHDLYGFISRFLR